MTRAIGFGPALGRTAGCLSGSLSGVTGVWARARLRLVGFPRTPLRDAATRGSAEVVAILLEAGADPTVADKKGFTPCMMAARRGHAECARLLRDAEARWTGAIDRERWLQECKELEGYFSITSPVAAAVVSDETLAPKKTPCSQLRGRRRSRTISSIGGGASGHLNRVILGQAEDKHVLGKPAVIARHRRRNAKRKTLLPK